VFNSCTFCLYKKSKGRRDAKWEHGIAPTFTNAAEALRHPAADGTALLLSNGHMGASGKRLPRCIAQFGGPTPLQDAEAVMVARVRFLDEEKRTRDVAVSGL